MFHVRVLSYVQYTDVFTSWNTNFTYHWISNFATDSMLTYSSGYHCAFIIDEGYWRGGAFIFEVMVPEDYNIKVS